MAAEYLIQKSAEQQVGDIRDTAKLNEDDQHDDGEEADKNLVPLHYAAWYNKLDVVKSLLKYGADPNEEDNEGATALHYAARYKRRACRTVHRSASERGSPNKCVIKTLIEAGCQVNKQDNYQATPLMFAARRGNADAVNELLKTKGIAVNITDNKAWTALFVAVKYNRVSVASRLIETGADIFAKDDCRATPMHYASAHGHVDIMNVLFTASKGREKKLIDEKSAHGTSSLDMAVENRRVQAVELCLQHGATVMKTAKDNHVSPLHICAAVGGPKITKMLIDNNELLMRMRNTEQMIPLHKAAQYGRISVAKILIERGSDLEARDVEGNSPLLTAAFYGQDAIVRLLLKTGANITAMNRNDHNAIHLAAKETHCTSLRILLKSCKKQNETTMINAEDKLGRTPLYLACEGGHEHNVTQLLNAGGDMRHRTENEEAPIHVATRLGHLDAVKALLMSNRNCEESNISANEEDENINTPLHLSAMYGHATIAEMFIKCGADVQAMNRFNYTPLCYAANYGHNEVLKVLLKAGADSELQDANGDTPMHNAARKGHHKVLQTLLNSCANVCARNKKGNNVLDEAISSNNKAVVETILESYQWRAALRNRTPNPRHHLRHDETPLRKLIHLMPDLAGKVLDRCIDISDYKSRKDPHLCLNFDMEFLDDTYTATSWGDPECVVGNYVDKKEYKTKYIPKDDGCPHDNAPPYTSVGSLREFNHPLHFMVAYRRTKLLYHPLCLTLIRHKWQIAQYYFFAFLLFYSWFVAMLTYYMVNNHSPYAYNSNHSLSEHYQFSQCVNEIYSLNNGTLAPATLRTRVASIFLNREQPILGLGILIAAAAGIITEIIQLIATKVSYLINPSNIFDWFSYVAAILIVVPVEPCHLHLTHWQWQLGACCMFVAWLNLILFLRRMPRMGIYIVMVHEVFKTFFKFFMFCFSFFLFAFGFTFYVLMENQGQFSTTFYSCVKVGVMMIGELEYADLFHDADIPYESLTYAVFIIFLCTMTIIIMNLLTGLAVGDVQEIQEQAKLQKMAMQADFALNVEAALPEFLRKKLQCVKTKQSLHPNKLASNLYYKFGSFVSGPLSAKGIAGIIFNEVDEDTERDKSRMDFSPAMLNQYVENLTTNVESNKDDLAKLNSKMDALQHILKNILYKLTEENEDVSSDGRQDSLDTNSN